MVYINIQFPLQDDPNNYFLKRTLNTDDAIKGDLLLLLLTEKGSRKYFRDYGTNLKQYIFNPNDGKTQFDIEAELKTTVAKYLPTVTINSVLFEQDDTNRNFINTFIRYTVNDDFFTATDILAIRFDLSAQ